MFEPTDKQLLSRVDLKSSIKEFLDRVVADYKLGKILRYELIKIGYQELNVKTVTTKKVLVIKIFSKGKEKSVIRDNIKALLEFSKAKIPVPQLLKFDNRFLYQTEGKKRPVYLCVMNFFEGKSFNQIRPTREDFKTLSRYLAMIHQLKFRIGRNYDSWATTNLLAEFKDKKGFLNKKDLTQIAPIIKEFKKIDFKKFKKCIIHGDLGREHVLKNRRGEYCLLDLGCMDFNAAVIDLAVFITRFGFNLQSLGEDKRIYELIISEYSKLSNLSQEELSFLWVLIRATYAAYLIGANYELKVNKDESQQTLNWLNWGRRGLNKFRKV